MPLAFQNLLVTNRSALRIVWDSPRAMQTGKLIALIRPFSASYPASNRIRPNYSVIKCRIIRPTSR
jgi:hypothetical protein